MFFTKNVLKRRCYLVNNLLTSIVEVNLHCNAHGLSIFIIVDYAQLFQGAISHVAHVTETGEIVALVESHILDPQQENIDPQVKLKLFVCLNFQPIRKWKACLYVPLLKYKKCFNIYCFQLVFFTLPMP